MFQSFLTSSRREPKDGSIHHLLWPMPLFQLDYYPGLRQSSSTFKPPHEFTSSYVWDGLSWFSMDQCRRGGTPWPCS